MRLVLLCALLSACLTPSLQPCGDLVCTEDAICIDNTVCALPDQLAACSGVDEGMSCNSTLGAGRCVLGVCVANECGDGIATGIEACDLDDLKGATCEDFGFYGGTLACTAGCVPDSTACEGKCGDMMVQAEFDEQCDTAPPMESCVDFGQDYGVLTCNSFCAPAISRDCKRYGWTELLPSTTSYMDAGGNSHGVFGISSTSIDVIWDGVRSSRTNPGWVSALANATIFVALGPTSLGWFDGQWHELAVGMAANWVTLADDGSLFGRTDQQCTLAKISIPAGVKTVVPSPVVPLCNAGVAYSATELYVPQQTDGVRLWDGVQWSVATPTFASILHPAGSRRFAAIYTQTNFVDVSGALTVDGPYLGGVLNLVGLAFDNDGNELRIEVPDDDKEFYIRLGRALFQLDPLESKLAETAGRTADGRALLIGSGVRELTPASVFSALPPDTVLTRMVRTPDGVIGCGDQVYVTGLAGFVQRPFDSMAIGACIDACGSATAAHFVVTEGGLYMYNAGNNSYQPVLLSSLFKSVAGDYSQVYVAAGGVVLGIQNANGAGAAIEDAPSGCTIERVAKGNDGKFSGVGACAGKLAAFRRSATAWETLATSTIGASPSDPFQISVGDDGTVFVTHQATAYRVDGAVLTSLGLGIGVSAITADNYFLDRGGEGMLHVNGARRQEIAATTGPFAATRNHVFTWDRIGRRMYGIALVPSQPDGP